MTQLVPSTDGVQVALHDLGGEGPPLVFVHATGFHGYCYRQIAERLHDVRHCYGVDLRGHGDATVPENGRFDWAGMSEDLRSILDHMGVDEPIDFVGHSMGGATIVLTELHRPGTVRTAWLFEPIIFPAMEDISPEAAERMRNEPEHGNALSIGARKRRAVFDSYEAAIERYASRPPFDAVDPAVLDDYVRHGFEPHPDGVTLKCLPDSEAATFDNTDRGLLSRVGSVTAPMTVVASTDGQPPALVAPRVAEALANTDLDVWDGETHFGPFVDPQRAADEIRARIA